MPKHPDYEDDPELDYGTPVQWFLMYRDGKPESLLAFDFHNDKMPQDLAPNVESFRIPEWAYDLHVTFGTFPIRTASEYTIDAKIRKRVEDRSLSRVE